MVGDVVVLSFIEKEYEGRKYYNVTAMGTDKEVYKFSCRFEDHPKENDTFQMLIRSGAKDCRPQAYFQKVK